jgi:hypothetical protein
VGLSLFERRRPKVRWMRAEPSVTRSSFVCVGGRGSVCGEETEIEAETRVRDKSARQRQR